MRGERERAGIAVFAKAPIAGFAKTRLIPEIGANGAADLQSRLIVRSIATALKARLGPVSLWCAPNRRHDLFESLATAHGIQLYDQTGPDLGARMLHAFEILTQRFPVLLIGTDCPALGPSHLADSLGALDRDADAVFIPAEDGGYVLVGMQRPIPSLFCNVPWGTGKVMTETRQRASKAKLRIAEPTTLWDIDNMADYSRAVSLGLI